MQHKQLEVKQFIKTFYTLYYERKYYKMLDMFASKVILNGHVIDEAITDEEKLKKVVVATGSDSNFYHADLKNIKIDIKSLDNGFYKVNSSYQVYLGDHIEDLTMPFFNEFILDTSEDIKIVQLVFSLGMDIQGYLERSALTDSIELTAQQIQNNNIKAIYNTVPGGIVKCLRDDNLTLIEMSDGFLSMIGFTRDEVKTVFNNSLLKIVYPSDFEETMKVVDEQLKVKNTKEVEYRLIHKDGNLIWVLDKGLVFVDELNRECFHCILVDITKEKEMTEELRLSVERNQIILNQTNDVVFDWDLVTNKVLVSNNWYKKFIYSEGTSWKDVNQMLKGGDDSVIYEEDIPEFKKALNKVIEGEPYFEVEVRLKSNQGEYIWCRIRVTIQYDESHKPIKGVGIIMDIDQEKRKSNILMEQSTRDSLTGLYNRNATQTLIQNYIEQNIEEVCALMIIDIDDFKSVNDTKGHLYGDAVLSDIAKTMKEVFRYTDVIGRIGGDEFMVFIKNVQNEENTREGAFKILNSIVDLKSIKNTSDKVSCSIGISMFPKDGKEFNTLYQNADYALYLSKMEGKNCFSFYEEKNIEKYLRMQEAPYASLINSDIDSNANKALKGNMAEYVFEILYRSENIYEAIISIMEIVGNKYDVSRVYIFENAKDPAYCINTYEWCNTDIEPQIDFLQNVSYEEDLDGCYEDNFNENDLFYCPDIKRLPTGQYEMLNEQGIKSMLQCAIRDNGEFKGFIGFDECKQNRYWTQEQIDMLTLISGIISIFLLKVRKEEAYIEENETLLSMLDHQKAWIYAIDSQTNELLYMNKKMTNDMQGNCLGKACYSVFSNSDKACENCPAKETSKENTYHNSEFYNEKSKMWFDVNVSYIKLKGKDAKLIVCHDITKFK